MRTVCAALLYRGHCDPRLCLYGHCLCHGGLTDTLVVEPIDPVVDSGSKSTVTVLVEVVASSGAAAVYSVDVPKGDSLLEALEILKGKNVGFT